MLKGLKGGIKNRFIVECIHVTEARTHGPGCCISLFRTECDTSQGISYPCVRKAVRIISVIAVAVSFSSPSLSQFSFLSLKNLSFFRILASSSTAPEGNDSDFYIFTGVEKVSNFFFVASSSSLSLVR